MRQSGAPPLTSILRGTGLCRPRGQKTHFTDKTKALASDGTDQFLFLAIVADRLARGIDATNQGRVRHNAASPNRGDQIVLADNAVAVFDQMNQQIEHLGLNSYYRGPAPQLSPAGIEPVI